MLNIEGQAVGLYDPAGAIGIVNNVIVVGSGELATAENRLDYSTHSCIIHQ